MPNVRTTRHRTRANSAQWINAFGSAIGNIWILCMCVYFYRATGWQASIARARAAHDGARAIDRDGRVVRARDGRARDGRDGNRTNRRERRKGKERTDRIESNRIESNRIATETRRKGDERSTAAMAVSYTHLTLPTNREV